MADARVRSADDPDLVHELELERAERRRLEAELVLARARARQHAPAVPWHPAEAQPTPQPVQVVLNTHEAEEPRSTRQRAADWISTPAGKLASIALLILTGGGATIVANDQRAAAAPPPAEQIEKQAYAICKDQLAAQHAELVRVTREFAAFQCWVYAYLRQTGVKLELPPGAPQCEVKVRAIAAPPGEVAPVVTAPRSGAARPARIEVLEAVPPPPTAPQPLELPELLPSAP